MKPLEVAARALEDHAQIVAEMIAERAKNPSDSEVEGIREFVKKQRLESARAMLLALAAAALPDFFEEDGEQYAMPSPAEVEAFRNICRIIAGMR